MKLPRHAEIWLVPYLKDRLRKNARSTKPKRIWVAITDHYEPMGMGTSVDAAHGRVSQWRDKWPRIAEDAPRDAAGQRPQYTFFYPQEEYRRDLLDRIAEIVHLGVGDVEVHLHHDNELRDSFIQKITDYSRRLTCDHGLLHQQDGRTVFGFIHGNWALDNSRPDGKWCGLNGEIALLRDLGCYADFTMPSAPSATQGRVLNQIYWCTNNAGNRPKSFDRGIEATVGGGRQGDLLNSTISQVGQYADKMRRVAGPSRAMWMVLQAFAWENLREKDRQAIVLRFYEGRNLREVGLALGASEDAAEKRVSRALEKLRKFFTKRGVALSCVAMAGAILFSAMAGLRLPLIRTRASGYGTQSSISTGMRVFRFSWSI